MEKTIFKSLEQLEEGLPSDQIIRLKSVFKQGKTTVQPVSDGTGWYKGVPRYSEEQKRGMTHWSEPTSKAVIKDGTTFDLRDEAQRVTWGWVKYSPCIALSEEECQFTPGAEFYIYLENEEAQKSVSRKELKYKASKLIMEDNSSNYPLRVKLLGVNMDGESAIVLKEFLMDEADKRPETILAIYESHDLSQRLLLLKAMDAGIIKKDGGSGIYTYGNTVLGMTEASCIAWMQDKSNKNIVELLEKEVNPEYFEKEEVEPVKEFVPINKRKNQ